MFLPRFMLFPANLYFRFMRTTFSIIAFICCCAVLLFSFKPKEPTIVDKTLLDIVAYFDKLPLFNYTVKMAAVDTRPYNPNDPVVYPPTTVFKSRSADTTTHGGKLFRLRIKDDSNYAYDLSQPDGQTLVMATYDYIPSDTTLGDGKALRIGKSAFLKPTLQHEYYIMYKPQTHTYPTDSGWVYGIVSADGKTVLQKGLIVSCMKCHSASKTDRTFGAR